MAYEKPVFTHTFRASTGLRQHQAVALSGANNRLIDPTTEGNCIGILVSSGTTGSTGRAGSTDSGSVQTVQTLGIAKVLCGTTGVAVGSIVKDATDGQLSKATYTSYRLGIALGAAASTTTSNETISVLLSPSYQHFA